MYWTENISIFCIYFAQSKSKGFPQNHQTQKCVKIQKSRKRNSTEFEIKRFNSYSLSEKSLFASCQPFNNKFDVFTGLYMYQVPTIQTNQENFKFYTSNLIIFILYVYIESCIFTLCSFLIFDKKNIEKS